MATTGGTTRISFIERLRTVGDTRSWANFHHQYGELLVNYARRLGASRELSEDIAQEVELGVFRAMRRFEHRSRKGCFRAYLRSSVVHALGRRARQRRHEEATLDPRALDALAKTDCMQDAAWQREHYLHRIRWGMRCVARDLEPVTVEAFRLHVLDGRGAAETAAALSISEASVYQAKSRVIKRLREIIAAMDSDIRD